MKDRPHELILLNDLKLILFSPVCITSCLHMCVLPQSCPTLCNPVDCSLPGISIHGFPRQKYWSWLPFLSPGDLPDPGIEAESSLSPAWASGFFTTEPR